MKKKERKASTVTAMAAAKAGEERTAGQQHAAELQDVSGQALAEEGTSGQTPAGEGTSGQTPAREGTSGQTPAEKDTSGSQSAEEEARKKIAQMSLLDDFLFGSVVAYPGIGEQFVGILLKTIFGREFKYLSVTAQKVLYGADTDLHGARLDVYIEPEEREPGERAVVYDVEPDRKDSAKDKKALPRRVRFYHGKIVARSLHSGTDYDGLKNAVIIMILPFDPFGLDRMVYTVKNKCIEEPEMEYDDGACTLFLYTNGSRGIPNDNLRQLLCYMKESTRKNAVNEDLREVHRMVEIVKLDPETTISCMRLTEKLDQSRKEGEAIGEAKGRTEGKIEELVTRVCRKMKLGQSLEKIAEDLVEEVSVIEPIYHAAERCAPEYEPESVLHRLAAKTQNKAHNYNSGT